MTTQHHPSHNTHRLQLVAIRNHGDRRAERLQVWADVVVGFRGDFAITFALRRRLENLCIYAQNYS